MIPTGSKLWFGVSAFALAACVVYFAASSGEEYGSMVMASLALAAFTLGLLSSFLKDGDVDAESVSAGGTAATSNRSAQLAAIWPVLAAFAGAVAIVGLATDSSLFYLGVALAVAAGAEWMIQAWAERATDDPAANRELRNRLMYPIEIPVVAALLIGFVIIAFSRVLLAVPKLGSTVIAIVIAALILAVAFVLTSRPKLSSSVLTGVAALGAVALLGGGVVGAVVGEREFEHHGGDDHAGGDGAPVTAIITASNVNDFDEDEINVPLGEPVLIEFHNEQLGVQHNVHIVDLEDVPPTEIITGPDTLTFEVMIDEAGQYEFICDVYPDMASVINVVDQPATGVAEDSDDEDDGAGASAEDLVGEE